MNVLGSMAKRSKVAHGIGATDQMTLRWRDYAGSSGCTQCAHRSLLVEEKQKRENQRREYEKPLPSTAGLEDGRRDHEPRNVKVQGRDAPLELPEQNSSANTWTSAHSGFLGHRTVQS